MVYPEVFVGRQKQIVRFQEHFTKQFKKSGFSLNPFSKKKKEAPYAQVFLLYGEDGFGKTSLLQAYLQAAEEVAQSQKSKVKTIYINWESYYDRKSVLPNTRVKMMDALVIPTVDSTSQSGPTQTEGGVNCCICLEQKLDRSSTHT